jgi:hypothetical protein
MLVTSIARLSWAPADQERFLRAVGTWPSLDELVLEVSMALDLRRTLAAEGLLVEADLPRLDAVASALDALQAAGRFGPEDLTASEWQDLRRAAMEFLSGEEF